MTPNTEAPRLQTFDDRFARIESLLVGLATRLDRIERSISSIRAGAEAPKAKPR
jgi:hypothetical protein